LHTGFATIHAGVTIQGHTRRIHVETHSDVIDRELPAVFERAAGKWRLRSVSRSALGVRRRSARPTSRAAGCSCGETMQITADYARWARRKPLHTPERWGRLGQHLELNTLDVEVD
jgi:hypothetical protein